MDRDKPRSRTARLPSGRPTKAEGLPMSTILCIDDEPALLDEIVAMLKEEGYNVLQAADGAQGIEAIIAHAPDLVICDITMPRMDGHELIAKLRQDHPQHADTPVIFLSALAERHDVLKGIDIGADEYLTKPVDFELLIAKAKACLRQVKRMKVQTSQQLAQMAHSDVLTGLANRALLKERLDQALQAAKRPQKLAVLFLDLDRFKNINDTLGHTVGDELLRAVATRLRDCVRETDTIARLGGDEFAVVQTLGRQPQGATILAKRIRETLQAPFDLTGHQVVVDTSIGIAVAPDDGVEWDEVLKNADLALYEAKHQGRGQYRFFEPAMAERMQVRRALEVGLRTALENDQFELHYQPLVNVKENKLVGFEALLRWHHPERGIVPPSDFISIAEDTGLINPIGDWVLQEACAEATTWPDDFSIAVNVSPVQIRSGTLPLKVVNALAKSGLLASRLELEVTESMLLESDEDTLAVLSQLRELGVAVVIDDFGTGYSSLSYLKNHPFDKVKIGRSIANDVVHSHEAISIVRAVIDLAKALNMTTTAEGIETEGHLDIIKAQGCTYAQGYLFGRPQPAEVIARQHCSQLKGKVGTKI